MAPVLQCPECGTKHPLDTVGPRSAFPCTGCGRTLKVPEQARAMVPQAPPAPSPAPEPVAVAPAPPSPAPVAAPDPDLDSDSTSVFSTTAPPLTRPASVAAPGMAAAGVAPAGVVPPGVVPAPARDKVLAAGAPLGPVPGRWARFGMWVIAVPLAFLVVFGLAKTLGILTTNQITDVALAEGWNRFVPIARLVPFVALVTAGIVHGGAYGIARLRASRSAGASGQSTTRAGAGSSTTTSRTAGKSSGSGKSRRPRQPSNDGR